MAIVSRGTARGTAQEGAGRSIPPSVQVPAPGEPVVVEPEQPSIGGDAAEVLAGKGLPPITTGNPVGTGGLDDLHPFPSLAVFGGELMVPPWPRVHLHRARRREELQREDGSVRARLLRGLH